MYLLATVPPILSDRFSEFATGFSKASTVTASNDSSGGLDWLLLDLEPGWRRPLDREELLTAAGSPLKNIKSHNQLAAMHFHYVCEITETYRSVRLEYFCIPFTRRIFLSILMSGRQMPRIWRALCWSRRWYIRVCASFVSIAFTSSVSSWPSRFSSVTVSAAARCIAIVATSYMIIIH